MSETKVILLCGSRIALPVLRDLFFHGHLIAVAIPQHCKDFIQQVEILLKHTHTAIIIVNKTDFEEKLQEAISKYSPAMGLMFTFSFKLPAAIFKMPAKGFYNLHPGPLPAYRGPDPIFQQIKNREPYAAITIHKVDDDFDSGEIVLSDKIRLGVNDTYGILTTKLAELTARLVDTLIKMAGFDMQIPSKPQDSNEAKYYPRQTTADIKINWQTMDAASIVALINACNPWNKGAATMLNGNIIRLLNATTLDLETGNLPGTITAINENALVVATAGGQAVSVITIYNDEGFLLAGSLKEMGIVPGTIFADF
jgi:methionyl-tRNA formyltransferase